MEKKRKLPARAARVESISKKRTITPPETQSHTSPPAHPQNPVPERTPLPTCVVPGRSLPTVPQPQPTDLSSRDYQSISESGVLTESLVRSRQKWTSEGIFEKYWTKVRKGKNAPGEPPGNPSKDSMTKLGTCTITVEPHIFEATMFAVKDPNSQLTPSQLPMPTPTLPTLQYGPPGGFISSPISGQENSKLKPQASLKERAQSSPLHPENVEHKPSNHHRQINSQSTNSTACPINLPRVSGANQIEPVPSTKSSDPVIQMLAQRAATDSDLKDLMRVVAIGEATTEQLNKFQEHIAELTRIQKIRQAQISIGSSSAPTITSAPKSPNQPQKQALKFKGPLSSNKQEITGVVLEFSGGNGDRYSFPKYSILEFPPGTNQVIASFLIIRKGSDAEAHTYDMNSDYYQPMTIRIYAHQSRQLEALQKAVESPDEVRKWMNKVMDECQRAEYVLLAMRLPREGERSSNPEAKDTDRSNEQVNWATTNTPLDLPKTKSKKKLPTEEELYENFVSSVAAVT